MDQADPFYAHCKMHSDKTLVRRRKRNWLALQLRTQQRRLEYEQEGYQNNPEQVRIQRKLRRHRQKFLGHKTLKSTPWGIIINSMKIVYNIIFYFCVLFLFSANAKNAPPSYNQCICLQKIATKS